MREIRNDLIKAHAQQRFRSEYDYALFEYYRSAKLMAFLDRMEVRVGGRVLDCGCGGGGMPLSFAEEADHVTGIDPMDRFSQAGVTLARERNISNVAFARTDGMALPFASGTFDLVLSHSVIEHVADAALYLKECRRVMKAGARMYLSTAPYLSPPGAHLPHLLVPIPLHLLIGRSLAFRTFCWLARHAPRLLREPAHENSFIRDARLDVVKHDDLLEKVRMRRLRRLIAEAGLTVVHEHLQVIGTVRRLPPAISEWLRDSPLTQDIVLGNVEYVLAPEA
ncbi:MAG: class I SAM-dependent methyltransferase [Acidobacteriota bacterium]